MCPLKSPPLPEDQGSKIDSRRPRRAWILPLGAALLVLGIALPALSQQRDQANDAATAAFAPRWVPPPALPAPPSEIGPLEAGEPAAAAEKLTLQDVLDLATRHNPTLSQARAQVDGAMGAAIQAGLYPNPEVAYVAEQIGVEGTVGEFHGAVFRQEVVTAGKLRLSRAKYLERVAVAEALALAQQYRVCNDIRIHFYDVLGHDQRLQILRELQKSAEDAALTARELYNVGQANRVAVLRSNVQLQRARLDVVTAENRYQQASRRLTSLVGVELATTALEGKLEGDPEVIDFQAALLKLWECSPRLLAARAKLRGDQVTVGRERVEPIPNLQLEAGGGYNFEAEETVAVASIGVKLPLWDRNQGTIRQAQADVARQQAEIARLEMGLRSDLADTYAKYATAAQRVQQYQGVILPDSQEAYRTLLHSYQEDRAAWPDVLEAQRIYYLARVEYVDALVEWRTAEVLIDGMLLHGGLMAAEAPLPAGHIDATPRPR